MSSDTLPKIVITLVHGTFARDADWCKPDSILCQRLTSAFPQVMFNPFLWSGSNSLPKRLAATQQLRDHLTKQIADFPNSRHYIIAHSHGGNIAWSSLSSSSLQCSVNGLICLSTPFLHMRERSLYPLMLSRDIYSIVGLAVTTVVLMVTSWLLSNAGRPYIESFYAALGPLEGWFISHEDLVYPGLFLAVCLSLYLLRVCVWNPTYQRADSFLKKVRQAMELPTLPLAKPLIIRMSGDEASAFLIASQFISWAISQSFRIFVKPFALAYMACGYDTRKEDEPNDFLATIAGVLSVILLLLLLPFFTILALIAIIPFGPHLALAHFFFEVTSESTPLGTWNIHQFGQASFSSTATTPGLSHSSYQDPEVIERIVNFIRYRQQVADSEQDLLEPTWCQNTLTHHDP